MTAAAPLGGQASTLAAFSRRLTEVVTENRELKERDQIKDVVIANLKRERDMYFDRAMRLEHECTQVTADLVRERAKR